MNSVTVGYLLFCFALLLLLVACGGMARPTIAPTPLLPNPMDVQAALLTASDLPSGWTGLPITSSNALSAFPCDATTPHLKYVTETVIFQQGEHGARVSETIAAFHSGEAERWMDAFQQGPTCAQFDEPGPQGTPVVTKITPLSLPVTGDQVFGYLLTTRFGGQSFETDVIYVRVGDNIMLIGESVPGHVDSNVLTSIEQKALDKLKATPF